MQEEPKTLKTDENAPDEPIDEEESNLLDLLIVLLKHKKMIISVVFLAGVLAVIYSFTRPNIYRSECTLAPTGQERGSGGLAALTGLSAMVASEAGITAAGSLDRFDVVLQSRELTNTIVQQHNLMPILFEKSWDKENKRWKVKKPPTLQDAYRAVQDILSSAPDKKKNIMTLTVEGRDPRLARTILNYYVEGLSEYLRSQTLNETTAQQAQLYAQLSKTSDPLLKTKLYDLIAQQIEKETLARVQKYYSFTVLDPAIVPERKFKPKRAQICILSVMAAFFVAVFLAFFLEYMQNLKTRENPERLANLRNALWLRKGPRE
jgi:uncharacterized protein involved in exopolysaccharide biosynthesis